MKKSVETLVETLIADNVISYEGDAAIIPEGTLSKYLPEGLSQEDLDKAATAKEDLAAAVAIAFGKSSKAHFDKNKDVQEVTLRTPLTKVDTLNVNIKRTHEVSAPPAEAGGERKRMVRHGYITVSQDTKSPVSQDTIRKTVRAHWEGISS